MQYPAANVAHCCQHGSHYEPHSHTKHLVFHLSGSHGRQMDQSGGNSHSIHLAHQGTNPFFIPEDIGEIREFASDIVVGDA